MNPRDRGILTMHELLDALTSWPGVVRVNVHTHTDPYRLVVGIAGDPVGGLEELRADVQHRLEAPAVVLEVYPDEVDA